MTTEHEPKACITLYLQDIDLILNALVTRHWERERVSLIVGKLVRMRQALIKNAAENVPAIVVDR